MSPVTYIIIAVIIAAAVGRSIMGGVREARRERAALHAFPRTAIRDLVDGARMRVVGTAVSNDELVRAPYSGRLCLAFRAHTVSVDVTGVLPGGTTPHIPSVPVQRAIAFRVRDDSGEIAVDVDHVTLILDDARVDLHEEHGAMVASLSGMIDYHESRLVEKQPVAVTGIVRRSGEGTVRLVGTTAEPLVVATCDGALGP